MNTTLYSAIEGFDNYIISSQGAVFKIVFIDFDKYQFKPVVVCFDRKSGYKRINLVDYNGKNHYVKLHRLLAQAFIPNPNNYKVVDHINRNKLDNQLINLRWATISENSRNRSDIGEFINILPEGCLDFKSYGSHTFTNYFINPTSQRIYYKILNQYRVLNTTCIGGCDGFWLINNDDKRAFVIINQLLLGHYNK